MMKNSDITVIILTYNSYTDKFGSIEWVVNSYLDQKTQPYQIIVINNGSDENNTNRLIDFCKNKPGVKIINCDTTVGGARNFGASQVKTKFILFTEDDTIMLDTNIIDKLMCYCSEKNYGYGANRLWSPDLNWLESNKVKFTNIINSGELIRLKEYGVIPKPEIRNKTEQSIKVLLKSFIGNFGLIPVKEFNNIGGFPEYPGYACEDDAFAFLCYLELGMPKVFNDIEILHISHKLKESSQLEYEKNKKRLQNLIEKKGFSEFHITRILFPSEKPIIVKKQP